MDWDCDADKTPGKVKRFVLWGEEKIGLLPLLYDCERFELAVMDTVPCHVYEAIERHVKLSRKPMEIINKRKHYPPYPPVLWIVVKTVEQVVFLKPEFDAQIVVLTVHPDVDPHVYVDIAFHAELRGFLVLNTGPWRNEEEKRVIIGWDEGIFVSMLDRIHNQLKWATWLEEKEKASVKELEASLDGEEAVLGFFAEEYGSALAYAEAESITDALLESKQKQLSQLEAKLKLLHCETFACLEDQLNSAVSEIMEAQTRLVIVEAALKPFENQFNAESISCCSPSGVASAVSLDMHNMKVWHLQEKLWSYKGLCGIFRGKTLAKLPWSLVGISASLGLSVLVYSYFSQVGENHIHMKRS